MIKINDTYYNLNYALSITIKDTSVCIDFGNGDKHTIYIVTQSEYNALIDWLEQSEYQPIIGGVLRLRDDV